MSKKLCRLCFFEKPRPIDIFSAEAIDMNIVEGIRVHFADEVGNSEIYEKSVFSDVRRVLEIIVAFQVKENDNLPKTICRGCSTKLKHFHEFYNAVNEARKGFLLEFVNNMKSNCTKINFGSVHCRNVDDIPLVKLEPKADVETSSMKDDRIDADKMNNSSPDHFGDADFSNDAFDTDDDESEFNKKADVSNAKTAHDLSQEIAGIGKNTTAAKSKKVRRSSGKFDYLISSYINMFCDICEHPFETLTEATLHYRREHNRKYVNVKCCRRQISIPGEIRDHIQYHLNPVKFK